MTIEETVKFLQIWDRWTFDPNNTGSVNYVNWIKNHLSAGEIDVLYKSSMRMT
jgi:hypothetical protein